MTLVCSAISLSGSCFIFFYYWRFKELRTFAFKLVLCVAISDSIRCIGNLFGLPENTHVCNAQGMLKTFGGAASFMWVMCMALTIRFIYMSVEINGKTLLFRYQYIVWTIASISALIPLFTGDYDQLSIGWCWINNEGVGAVLRYTSFYAILFVAIAWICFVYLELWFRLKGLPEREEYGDVIKRLWLYPLVLIIGYGPAATRRVLETAGGTAPYWLAALQAANSSLMGLLNTCVYGINADVRKLTEQLALQYCCRSHQRPSSLGSSNTVWNKDSKSAPSSTKSNASSSQMVEIKKETRPADTTSSLPPSRQQSALSDGNPLTKMDTVGTDFLVSPKSDQVLAGSKKALGSSTKSIKSGRNSAIEMTPPKRPGLMTARTMSNKKNQEDDASSAGEVHTSYPRKAIDEDHTEFSPTTDGPADSDGTHLLATATM